ncbi:MAG: DUF3093 domain-containing protein [Leucobacter sp.]
MSRTSPSAPASYRERLWPTPWLFVALLLIIPAVALVVTPMSTGLALPLGIALYVLIAGSLTLMSPTIAVEDGVLVAGRARIPVAMLGTAVALDSEELRAAIGPGLDARAHLMVRGYIHRGAKVEVVDPADPAPYWVVTTRRPQSLLAAIEAAR